MDRDEPGKNASVPAACQDGQNVTAGYIDSWACAHMCGVDKNEHRRADKHDQS
jgi:hypothetical protein